MSEILTVVHISPQRAEQMSIKRMLGSRPQIKLIAQLELMQDALIFCPATLPNIIIVYAHPLAEGFPELLEKLIELCPCSSFMLTYEHLPLYLIEAMKQTGVEYFIPKPITQGLVRNILSLAEQRKRGWGYIFD